MRVEKNSEHILVTMEYGIAVEFIICDDRVLGIGSVLTRPFFKVGHRMEWMEQAMHLRINTASWSRGLSHPRIPPWNGF